MANLEEIGKIIANNPTFKLLDSLPLAAITMPPGLASLQKAGEQISKFAASALTLPAMHNMPGFALAQSVAEFDAAMKAATASDKMFRQSILNASMEPTIALQAAMQAVFERHNAPFEALFAKLPAVNFEPPPAFPVFRNYSAPRRQQTLQPATPAPLLPTEIAQSRDYFARLIAELKTLPPPDIITVLDWQLSQQEGAARGLFLDRLAHYLADGKDFAPTCWQLVRLWLNSIRGKAPQPTWYNEVGTDATLAPAEHPAGLFAPLLLNYTINQLHALLRELGLITSANQAAPAASPGAWVGVIHGLLSATPPRLRNNKAAIQRAFCEQFGAIVGERAVQVGPSKRGSESERFRDSTLALLRERTDAD
jgi:hypothetical protein